MSEKLPDLDLKILAWLGLLFSLAMGSGLIFGSIYVVQEATRWEGCVERSEQDPGCQPGFLWPVFDSAEQGISSELD